MANRSMLILVVNCWALVIFGQNLVPNPGFEDHLPTQSQVFTEDVQFTATMKNWHIMNSHARICDCGHKMTADDIYYRACRLDKVKPIDGCTMMELSYGANCLDWEHETRGCSSYLGTKLTKPLEVGKTYEISFWINALKPDDPAFIKNIGFNLFPNEVRNKNGGLFDCSSFHIDSIVYENWVQVKWHVRPLCRLRYLVLGVFRGNGGPPVHRSPTYNVFYLDNIGVRELDISHVAELAVTPFCRCPNSNDSDSLGMVEGVNCYFELGNHALTEVVMASLDSFALRAKASPRTTFIITGHTDSTGENHQVLAASRVEAVLQYLEEKHRIPRLRFANYSLGEKLPLASNRTAEGRQYNRRGSITQCEVPAENILYRHVLAAVFEGDKSSAFKRLHLWVSLAPIRKMIWMLFDPRIDELKQDKRWKDVVRKIRASYKVFKKPELAFKLDSLWAEDQKARTLKYYIENLNTYFASMDSQDVRLNVFFKEAINNEYSSDTTHYSTLINIIGDTEWPKLSEVGERAAKAAFLIVDHQTDPSILMHFLPILEARCQEGEADWLHFATMYDRLQVMQGKPQRYGTQFRMMNDNPQKLELYPLENDLEVNEWRKMLGLPPIPSLNE